MRTNQFEVVPASFESDRACKELAVCEYGFYESKAPEMLDTQQLWFTSDRVCSKCQECLPGVERLGCAEDSAGVCVACEDGEYEMNGKCLECDECSAGFVRSGCGVDSPGSCVQCGQAFLSRTDVAASAKNAKLD